MGFLDQLTTEDFLHDGGSHAAELDSFGFLAAPGETKENYLLRIVQLMDLRKTLYHAVADRMDLDELVGFRIGEGDPVPEDILTEAGEKTNELFGFHADWAPAFFPEASLGLLWGGCTVMTNEGFPLFFIRKEFRKRKKWFIYRRQEILSHELCHAVRGVLRDDAYEEHFAYMTSGSRLRRYMGNCFQHDYDAILFVLPVFLLLAVQLLNFFSVLHLPQWIFWILALAYPAFLLIRNAKSRSIYFRAEKVLKGTECSLPKAVLFRCTTEEIRTIAGFSSGEALAWITAQADSEFRWYVIVQRFFNERRQENGTVEGSNDISG